MQYLIYWRLYKKIIWNGKNPNIQHSTLLNSYKDVVLEEVDIFDENFVKTSNFTLVSLHGNNNTKSSDYIKLTHSLESKLKYCWLQLTDALPKLWRDCFLNFRGHSINLYTFGHHLIEKNKLESRELYQIKVRISTKNFTVALLKHISSILISTGSQHIYYCIWST